MASLALGLGLEDEYSEEELEEDEWQDQELGGEGGLTGGNKHHQSKNPQITDLVSVSEFKTHCREGIKSVADKRFGVIRSVSNGTVAKEIGVTASQLRKMREECKPSKLLPPNGFADFPKLAASSSIEETQFKSLKSLKELRIQFHKIPLTYGYDLRLEKAVEVRQPVEPGEVVLSVAIFHPLTKNRDQEFSVLGCQRLVELRDKIVCHNDYLIKKDFSENPSSLKEYMKTLPNPPNFSPSAFFFINNTFYNDRRHPLSTDLSRPIIEWSSVKERLEQSHRLEPFSCADMATTRFDELSMRLGYPYLFTHHTDCEHLLQFTDLRLYHPSTDKPSLSDYPRLTFRHKRKTVKCTMCKCMDPQWVTYNDELAPCSPCHFCDDCFTKLHYSKSGKKLAKFEAYPFH